jgi:hypothetical protein
VCARRRRRRRRRARAAGAPRARAAAARAPRDQAIALIIVHLGPAPRGRTGLVAALSSPFPPRACCPPRCCYCCPERYYLSSLQQQIQQQRRRRRSRRRAAQRWTVPSAASALRANASAIHRGAVRPAQPSNVGAPPHHITRSPLCCSAPRCSLFLPVCIQCRHAVHGTRLVALSALSSQSITQ